ncbi:hypothetical protein CDL15_Pgr016754 [Punica granatum]|uniref:Uncharacterized protein n=1 Tax=Punica granatum TaxID=22663 RepID=A0A218WX41_PUNGR|nr:hypothetical protein CDL15_Pgr016754 [Punica granatum]
MAKIERKRGMVRDIAARKRAPRIDCGLEEKRRVGGEFQIELREPRGPEKNRAAGRVYGGKPRVRNGRPS